MSGLPHRALVVGLGQTGRTVATVLARHGVRVRAVDQRADEALTADLPTGVEPHLGTDGTEHLGDVDLVVPSPGVRSDAPVLAAAARRGVPIESEIEVATRLLACPIVAITGTNGKSTTTTLVGLALAEAGRRTFVGGNLGTPLIAAADTAADVAVAEVSSFQLEWVERFRPRVACLLNLTPDHLDRHGSFAAYRAAKARLFAAQGKGDAAVLNRGDPEVWGLHTSMRARVESFGPPPAACTAIGDGDGDGGGVRLRLAGVEERYTLTATRLSGRHNLENILAAVTVARLAGAPAAAVQTAIDTAEPLPHRLVRVAERGGVAWWNDSKATNVGAAVRSLESFEGPVVLLAGGVDKGGGYDPLARAARGRVRLALLFGAAREKLAEALGTEGVATELVASLESAVEEAAVTSRPGETVLLAPACASFDMFTDYAARGEAFATAVRGLG